MIELKLNNNYSMKLDKLVLKNTRECNRIILQELFKKINFSIKNSSKH
jgi:hypothetical protein